MVWSPWGSATPPLGVEVFGLSTQDMEHQLELSVRLGVPFPLLSDAAFRVQKALRL